MFEICVTAEKLEQLSKLADWQLRQQGFDPASITLAKLRMDNIDEVLALPIEQLN